VVKEVDELVGELVPEFPLPELLKLVDGLDELGGDEFPLLGEELGDGVNVHVGGSDGYWRGID
jgi:hypothetical protein